MSDEGIRHVQTSIEGDQYKTLVKMRFADAQNNASIDVSIPFEALDKNEVQHPHPGGIADSRLQLAALQYVRNALDAEIERLSNQQGR